MSRHSKNIKLLEKINDINEKCLEDYQKVSDSENDKVKSDYDLLDDSDTNKNEENILNIRRE